MKNKDVFLIVKQYQHVYAIRRLSGNVRNFSLQYVLLFFCYTDTPDYYYYHADGHRQTDHKRFSTQYYISYPSDTERARARTRINN